MLEVLPEVRVPEAISGHGELILGDRRVRIVSFRMDRDRYGTDTWKLTAEALPEERDSLRLLIPYGPNQLEFEAVTRSGDKLVMPRLEWTGTRDYSLTAEVHEVLVNPDPLPKAPEDQWLEIYLSPTHLALPIRTDLVRHWTGEVKALDEEREPRKPLLLTTSAGVMALSERYLYSPAAVAGTRSELRIPCAALFGEVLGSNRASTPAKMFRALSEELEAPLRVMSFLSRRHVALSRLSLTSRWRGSDSGGDFTRAELWTSGTPAARPPRLEPLVNAYRLPPDALDRLVSNYRALPWVRAAESAIIYLIESSLADFVDAQVLNAFTALEALVTGVMEARGRATVLPAAKFKKLQRAVRTVALDVGPTLGMSERDLEQVCFKIPELNRPRFLDRALELLDEFRIEWRDLWAPGSDLSKSLSGPVSRRNRFVHGGELASPLQAFVDARRIHALAERLLYAMLQGDPTWPDYRATVHLKELVKIDAHLAETAAETQGRDGADA